MDLILGKGVYRCCFQSSVGQNVQWKLVLKTLLTPHRPQGSENHTRIPPTILKLIKKKRNYTIKFEVRIVVISAAIFLPYILSEKKSAFHNEHLVNCPAAGWLALSLSYHASLLFMPRKMLLKEWISKWTVFTLLDSGRGRMHSKLLLFVGSPCFHMPFN